ncbi:MAG TPA: ArsR family transcriptional regulator [Candidatus Binatia bacterium]|jgi:DNA-binding transcriptional ArsR family regulator|nr:ArsR family transcriptional regulator [Candidatus Binatia bacterium]
MNRPLLDEDRIEELRRLISAKPMREQHRRLRVVGGLTRFRILSLLTSYGGVLNVTEIAGILGTSTSAASHELLILRKNHLVDASVRGREVYYKSNGLMERLFPSPQ